MKNIKKGDWFIDLFNSDRSQLCDSDKLAEKLNRKRNQIKIVNK